MPENNLDKIKDIIETILRLSGFEGAAAVSQRDNFTEVNVSVKDNQARYLIGRAGENLIALQHLARAIVNKQFLSDNLKLDIDGYQKNREMELKNMVLAAAEEAARRQTARFLAPMNGYERRLVHLALTGYPGVEVVSEGEGENRRIIIRPANSCQ